MTNKEKANIKYRLSDIGKQVGDLALEYIAELEKEIEQLKAYESHWDEIEEDAKIIAEENARLSNSVTELTNSKTELENKVTELEKQNEKMRCCGNCEYRIKKNLEGKIWVELCEKSYFKKNCEEWELAKQFR